MQHLNLTSSPQFQPAETAAVLDSYIVEDQVGFLMRRTNQRHTAIFQDGMTGTDLTPTQFTAWSKSSNSAASPRPTSAASPPWILQRSRASSAA